MDSADIAAFVRTMDVLLVTSTTETFGQSAVQAMLTGLPTIASDLPTMREKLDPPEGVAAGDAESRRAGLIYMAALATDPARRAAMGRVARARALERYVWDSAGFAREYFGVG
jgi:glycosyltransferase involved in cell wall biosynthesis